MRKEKSRTEHCGIETRKFGERVVERKDFGGTHKGEVTGWNSRNVRRERVRTSLDTRTEGRT